MPIAHASTEAAPLRCVREDARAHASTPLKTRLAGALAASVTPMTQGGRAVDTAAVGGLVEFLAAGGVDGVLVGGTTGEGVLLDVAERRRVTDAFVAAAPDGFAVAVHAGAQTTLDTVAIAAHAASAGASAVAVIAPPYFHLD